jgi:hypothetical protein
MFPSQPDSVAFCPCKDAVCKRRNQENEDRASGCHLRNGIIVRSPLALFKFAAFLWKSHEIGRYKQMQRETQEYFMTLAFFSVIL